MNRRGSPVLSMRLRAVVLLPAGAFLVHQLRYALAYGPRAGIALAEQGHSYLSSVEPWLVLLLCILFGGFVARVGRAVATGQAGDRSSVSPTGLWALTTAGLVAIFVVQELLEGLLAEGHPPGLTGIFGRGGWWAIVAACAVAALIVILLRVAAAVVEVAARRGRAGRRLARRAGSRGRLMGVDVVRIAPLARAAAGRAPPRATLVG